LTGDRYTPDEDMGIRLSSQTLGALGNDHADPRALLYKGVVPVRRVWQQIYRDPIEAVPWFAAEWKEGGFYLSDDHLQRTFCDSENNKTPLFPNRVGAYHLDGPSLRDRGYVAKHYTNHNT
jgi:hypothetical protein